MQSPFADDCPNPLQRTIRLTALMGSGGLPPGVTATAGDGHTPPIVTLEDLLAAQIPPIEFYIEQILCAGVTNLSGRPKVGKSWLAAAMALALSTGGTVLGFRARLVKVLYLALEDSAGRLQDRFRKLRAQANRNLHVALGRRALDEGGLEDIDTAVVREGYQVVSIDTFSRAHGRADQMDPNEMTQIYAALQQVALRHGIAIVVVDHHRKSARNPLESDAEYALTWDPESFTWHRKEDGKPASKETGKETAGEAAAATAKGTRPPSIHDRKYAELLPEAMAVHSLILMFDMLEALECTHEQIEGVFGPEVMLYLTGLLYGAQQVAAGVPTPLAALPLITINGRRRERLSLKRKPARRPA